MKTKWVYFLLTLCVLFWSGNFIIGRYIINDIEPLEMVFFRWGFTLVIISPFIIFNIKKLYISAKNNFFIIILLSFLGISLFNTLLYIGLNTTTSTNALIINSSIPILILLFSFLIFKTSIDTKQILGILLSSFGVLFLILKGRILEIFNFSFTSGDLWVIMSSLSWALYSTLVKVKPKDISDIEFFFFNCLFWFYYVITNIFISRIFFRKRDSISKK